jgi:transcriptional regulator with XRE-family HTH domain
MIDYTPTDPRVADVTPDQLSDKAWRYAWANPKLRWSIAKQVHDLRVARGLTQKQLADLIEMHQSAIARIENPRSQSFLALSTLVRIASALDVAFIARFVVWSEWLESMAALEAGEWAPPTTFDEEIAAERR